MGSRFASRVAIVRRALAQRATGGVRRTPHPVRRILIAHHLLLGDTLSLTPLLAKLRREHPQAELLMALPRPFAPLYAGCPYGVRVLPWNPRDAASVRALLREPPVDLAFVPGDNRHSWLALAMGAKRIVAFGGDRPAYKSWAVDELHRYPPEPATWADMTAALADGPPPAPYRIADWPAPPAAPCPKPDEPYALLHVGASSPLKLWEPARWRALADALRARGLAIVWSAGPGERALVDACGPAADEAVHAGTLDLAQLWHLVAGGQLLVCPDTGLAHLGRHTGTPTAALFGPGSHVLAGTGRFWAGSPFRAVVVAPFPCRDQHVLFKREIRWVNVCRRRPDECPAPRCMEAITLDAVLTACSELLAPAHDHV